MVFRFTDLVNLLLLLLLLFCYFLLFPISNTSKKKRRKQNEHSAFPWIWWFCDVFESQEIDYGGYKMAAVYTNDLIKCGMT